MQDRETAIKLMCEEMDWMLNALTDTGSATVSAGILHRWRGVLASPLSAPPQEPTGAKRHSLTDWIPTEGCDCDQCTAAKMATLKSISGSSPCDDMGEGWFVTVGRFGASFVTLEETHLGGKPYFTPEDKALVRGSARHLLSFIGELEPTGASPQQAETNKPCICRHSVADHDNMLGCGHRDVDGFSCPCEHVHIQPAPVSPVEPTPEPETCAWREDWRAGRNGSSIVPACSPDREIDAAFVREAVQLHGWKFCVHCGAPLRLVPSEETK